MAQTQYALSWDSYKSNVCNGFSALQQNSELVDLTLAADGSFVKVHKVLLALSSPYLKELISSAPCQHPVIFLNNVSYTTLCLILEYIYTGDVVVPHNHLYQFVETAKALHIRGLDNIDTTDVDKDEAEALDDTNEVSDTYQSKNCSKEVSIPLHTRRISVKGISTLGKRDRNSSQTSDNEYDMLDSTLDDNDMHDSDDERRVKREKKRAPDKSMKSSLQFTVSNRGALQVILNRYMYNLHSTQSCGIKRWRCLDYRTPNKCKAYLVTKGNIVLNRANVHCHSFHDMKILLKTQKNSVYSTFEQANDFKDKDRDKEDSIATTAEA